MQLRLMMVSFRDEEGPGDTQPVPIQGAATEADGGQETEGRRAESKTEGSETQGARQETQSTGPPE